MPGALAAGTTAKTTAAEQQTPSGTVLAGPGDGLQLHRRVVALIARIGRSLNRCAVADTRGPVHSAPYRMPRSILNQGYTRVGTGLCLNVEGNTPERYEANRCASWTRETCAKACNGMFRGSPNIRLAPTSPRTCARAVLPV